MMEDAMNNLIKEKMQRHNNSLSKYACLDEQAIYFKANKEDIRSNYFHDCDKILYALSFIRYMDKTQVFSFNESDHITKRMLHVQYVSKIARTIGRALALNEDLIEAIALGHDLGHTPFGHVGEKILSDLSLKHGEGYFNHNIQSVRMLMNVENYGNGLNVSMQVLDGIMCHNGEFAIDKIEPDYNKTKENFISEYSASYQSADTKELKAMSLEGCVVRISDMIAYLGRDLEDAYRMKLIKKEDISANIVSVLGDNNSAIVNTIILDIINNSIDKPYLKLSKDVYQAIVELKNFNYENIYLKANSKEQIEKYQEMFEKLFNKYLKDVEENNQESLIYSSFLNNMSLEYKNCNSKERIVIDYIGGMTDDYFIKQYNKIK